MPPCYGLITTVSKAERAGVQLSGRPGRRSIVVDTFIGSYGWGMRARVQRWGNSLAIRIPKAFAAEAGLRESLPVDLSVREGRLVIEAVEEPRITLESLLAGVTPDNLHGEVDFGPPAGNETW